MEKAHKGKAGETWLPCVGFLIVSSYSCFAPNKTPAGLEIIDMYLSNLGTISDFAINLMDGYVTLIASCFSLSSAFESERESFCPYRDESV